ncbi:putative peroxidase family protein [Skeletonema marinoi]|uniref:Peroxidase family protein n=1 Tax=Skeletonema marinoi TaxID=267567 RepID=A0AAD8YAV1_9STRA|nr:putative peroxidase family protein [Skeletonema marinoi]
MKLSFTAAVAAAAFSTHASAFKVVVDSDNNYCIMQVKYIPGNDWDTDSAGAITTLPSSIPVYNDGNGDNTIAQNGVNDPTGEILAAVQALGSVTVYDPVSGNALATQPSTIPGPLDWCQSYSTFAPEHYCKADGAWVGSGQKGTLGGTLKECCEDNHPESVYNSCIEKATGIVSMGDASWYGDQTDQKCVRNCDTLNLFDPDSTGSLSLHSFAVAGSSNTEYECGGLRPEWLDQDYADEDACCDDVFTSLQGDFCAYKSTTGSADPPTPAYTGTSEWYVDGSNSICKQDCIAGTPVSCGGTIEAASVELYTSAANCCSAQLAWLPSAGCEARSTAGENNPTDLFWASSDGCREDCTGGTNCESAPSSAKLYSDAEECCKKANNWLDLEWCETRAASDFSSTSTGTGQWFVDYEDGVCHKDCGDNSAECELATSGSLNFFSSASDCCKGSLGSVDQDACVQGSTQGLTISTVPTNKWYVASGGSGSDQPCKADCETSGSAPSCGGIVAKNGIRLYDSASDCCKQAYNWVDSDLCELQSENADQHTDLWYVDYGANVCKQDCEVDSNYPECDGYPEEQSTKMFTSASACCAAKLSWILKETCETASITGVDPTDSDSPGTGAWRKNDSWSYCVLDCKESGTIAAGDSILDVQPLVSSGMKYYGTAAVDLVIGSSYPEPCDGVTSDSSATQYQGSLTNCCKSINWVQAEVCYYLSTLGTPTQKYFADPSDRTKCVVHQTEDTAATGFYTTTPAVVCAAGKVTSPADSEGVECVEDIGVSTKLYDSLDECCKTNVSWDVDTCKYGSQGDEAPGSGDYYIDWSIEKCVQDCNIEAPGSQCNGIAKSWQTTFGSEETCCKQISWVNRRDCLYYQTR